MCLWAIGVLIVVMMVSAPLRADGPAWWVERGVINPIGTPDDYAVVNQGQVKHIAKQAYEEMVEKLPAGAGAVLDGIWKTPAAGTDDFAAVNIGQLKNVAQPFYDNLIEVGLVGAYPWSGIPDDFALANVGQVKNLFKFKIPTLSDPPSDINSNGLNDAWELFHFGGLGVFNASGDADADGVINIDELNSNSDPLARDNVLVGLSLFSPIRR